LWWAGFANLLCGVTTVCPSQPYEPDGVYGRIRGRVLKDYGWAHSFVIGSSGKKQVKKRETFPKGNALLHTSRGGHRQETAGKRL